MFNLSTLLTVASIDRCVFSVSIIHYLLFPSQNAPLGHLSFTRLETSHRVLIFAASETFRRSERLKCFHSNFYHLFSRNLQNK